MSLDHQCIIVATDDHICELIRHAANRLVVLAPAVHEKVACAVWRHGGMNWGHRRSR